MFRRGWNCRQLYVRARRHIDEGRPRFEASREERDELTQRFFAVAQPGDTEALIEMLAADVVVYGDGGGKAPSWPQPIYGGDRVAKLMAGTIAQALRLGASLQPTQINGQPGVLFVDEEGRAGAVMSLDITDGVIETIRSVKPPTSSPSSGRSPTSAPCSAAVGHPSSCLVLARPEQASRPAGRAVQPCLDSRHVTLLLIADEEPRPYGRA